MAKEECGEEQALNTIYNGGLRIYAAVDPYLQSQMETMMLNADDQYFPACWREVAENEVASGEGEPLYNEDGSLNLNPNSLTEKEIFVESNFADAKAYESFQFVRQGYFCVDSHDSSKEHLVFNRIVSLKSSFKLPK